MKKIFLVICMLLLPLTLLAASDMEPSYNGREKIDGNLKLQWKQAMHEGDLLKETDCMVRLNTPANKKILKELKDAGLTVGTVLKTVVTGRIYIGDLPILVSLDDVKSVEGGGKVGFK